MDINNVIKSSEYDFLRKNNNLNNKICLLTFGGSYAYGTNTPKSDIDIRGVALNSKKNILLGKDFEQVTDKKTDTTIYSFDKFIKLLLNCNPNVIEMLGCKKDTYINNYIGEMLLLNKEMFLSKRVIYTFGGYANAQLRRLQNAVARDNYSTDKKLEHIYETINHMIPELNSRYSFGKNSLNIYIDKSSEDSVYENEIYFDLKLNHYPIRDFNGFIGEMTNVVKQYDKLGKRNTKKDDLHLAKHMMHLIRLYLMCFDILENGEIITYRENDLELLHKIRSGYFLHNGQIDSSFMCMVDEYSNKLKNLASKTKLPDKPDIENVEKMRMYVNNMVVNEEIQGIEI